MLLATVVVIVVVIVVATNIMKLYLYILLLSSICISVFGFIAPALISSADTFLCILGIGIIVVVLPIIFILIKRIIKIFKGNVQ